MVRVDKVVVGIAEECRALTGRSPLAGGVGMGRELGLDLARRAECGFVQCVHILANGSGRISGIDLSRVPVLLRRRVLLVGISLDEACIDGHTLSANQALFDAPCNGRLEQVAQQLTLAEPTVPVFEKVE